MVHGTVVCRTDYELELLIEIDTADHHRHCPETEHINKSCYSCKMLNDIDYHHQLRSRKCQAHKQRISSTLSI